MSCLIKNPETNLYWNYKSQTWKPFSEATKFKTHESALNFITNTRACRGAIVTTTESDVYDKSKTLEEVNGEFDSLKASFEAAAADVSQISVLHTYYSEVLSSIDKEQEDLLHKIEFDSVQGIQGVRLVKMLKDRRKRRREVKDKIAFLVILSSISKGLKEVKSFDEDMEKRTYAPRVLTELFDNRKEVE